MYQPVGLVPHFIYSIIGTTTTTFSTSFNSQNSNPHRRLRVDPTPFQLMNKTSGEEEPDDRLHRIDPKKNGQRKQKHGDGDKEKWYFGKQKI